MLASCCNSYASAYACVGIASRDDWRLNVFTSKMEGMLKKAKTLNMSGVKQVILQELYLTRNPIIATRMLGLCNTLEETYR